MRRPKNCGIGLLRENPEDADCYGAYGELMLKTLNLEKRVAWRRKGYGTSRIIRSACMSARSSM